MRVIILDIESYYSDEYTLSKLSTEQYVRDPRFEAHGAAIKWSPDHAARWYDERQLRQVLQSEDWSDTFVICHHFHFDGLILSHHYGVHPKLRGCTLSMARLLLGNHIGVSLDSVRQQFGIPAKKTPYNLFKGKHWHELTPEVRQQVADGACDEVESIWKIFGILARDFPAEEYEVVDEILQMFTEPVLRADTAMLADLWQSEEKRKVALMTAIGVDESELQSADKFQALLEDAGVEIEYKNGKNGPIPAFAKNDDFMRGLVEHPNERISLLAATRLGVKSTILQTRAETLGWMASRGPLCVYLRHAGAGTLRPTGGDSSNFLNFKRGSPIRRAILAPEGYYLAPVDSSQIECRCINFLAGQDDIIEKFRKGEDPYIGIASVFYGETIYKPKKGDPRELEMEQKRGTGKQAELSCGYGSGGPTFKKTAKLGIYGPPVELGDQEAARFVQIYRSTHEAICARNTGYWAQAGKMLARLAGGEPCDWGPLHVRDHRIYLPNGCPLIYDTLEYHRPEGEEWEKAKEFEKGGYWRVRTRHGWKTMWGSKLVQNICEAVSRVIVSQAMVRLKRMGYRTLNWPYDELLLLIPKDGREEQHLQICMTEMKRTPDWLPGIPLDCEGSLSDRYSK